MTRRFIKDEDGAVATDWVVMTAAAAFLGVGVVAGVSTGMNSLGSDVDRVLGEASVSIDRGIEGLGRGFRTLIDMAFDDGNFDGWSSDRTDSSEDLGTFLGPFAGSEAALTYDVKLPGWAKAAVLEFDLLILNSWDADSDKWSKGRGDGMSVQINGEEVSFELFQFAPKNSGGDGNTKWLHDRSSTVTIGGTEYKTTMTLKDKGTFYGTTWTDQVWGVTLEATNPPPGGFTFGLDSTTDQGVHDEAFGVGSFKVKAR